MQNEECLQGRKFMMVKCNVLRLLGKILVCCNEHHGEINLFKKISPEKTHHFKETMLRQPLNLIVSRNADVRRMFHMQH